MNGQKSIYKVYHKPYKISRIPFLQSEATMVWDKIGKALRTNRTYIDPEDPEKIIKEYSDFYLSKYWGKSERKPYQPARERYEREKSKLQKFSGAELNVPEITDTDDENLVLKLRREDFTDFVDVFSDFNISDDYKISLFVDGLQIMKQIHNLRETLGDTYFKNFGKLEKPKNGSNVFAYDFEFRRESPYPQLTDVLMYTADALGYFKERESKILDALWDVYGTITFPFEGKDRTFFHARFGMGDAFFNHFCPEEPNGFDKFMQKILSFFEN